MTDTTTITAEQLADVRDRASEALGYVQAGQSDPKLYEMLYDIVAVLDGREPLVPTSGTYQDPYSNVCANCGRRIYVGRRIDGAWVWAHADTDLTTCREPTVDDWKPDREFGGMTMTLATAWPRDPWAPPAPAEPVTADTPF